MSVMPRELFMLLIFLVIPPARLWQRHGSPYTQGERAISPLEVRVENKAHYFDISDLGKFPRSVVTQTDAATNVSHVYEGVTFEQLLASVKVTTKPEVIRIEYGSRGIATISEADLDVQTQPMVVDTMDQRPLAAPRPYGFITKLRGKPIQTIVQVRRIVVEP